jgi:hypothetical protein
MAIDLGDLVDSLRREVNPPGFDLFPDATEDEWIGNLQDGFWEAVLDGIISGYNENDGVVTPKSGDKDLSREFQQLVVFYAGFRIVRNALRQINTVFRAKAGPVEYETQQAATILRSILNDLMDRRKYLLDRLADHGLVNSFYIDAVISRDQNIMHSNTWWVGS